MNNYEAWIDNYRRRVGNTAGLCLSSTQEMVAAFPELKQRKGFIVLSSGATWTHWWVTDLHGRMYDPAGNQWEPDFITQYIAYQESLHGHLSPALWHENVVL